MEDILESCDAEKSASSPEEDGELSKASKRYATLGKAKRVLWWVGLLLLSPVLIKWIGGDFDDAFCSVLTHFPSPCEGTLEQTATYMFRFALIVGSGIICWMSVIVIDIIQADIRLAHPGVDAPPFWRSAVAFGVSVLVLIMAFPVAIIISLALDI